MPELNYTNIIKKLDYDENKIITVVDEYEDYLPNGIMIVFDNNYYHIITKDYLREHNVDQILENDSDILNFDYKVGEPIIYECDIYFIKEMVNGNINSVTETISSSSMYKMNDQIFKLTPTNYHIMLSYKYIYDKLFEFSENYNNFGGYSGCYDHIIESWFDDTKGGILSKYDSCTNYVENQKNEFYGNRPETME